MYNCNRWFHMQKGWNVLSFLNAIVSRPSIHKQGPAEPTWFGKAICKWDKIRNPCRVSYTSLFCTITPSKQQISSLFCTRDISYLWHYFFFENFYAIGRSWLHAWDRMRRTNYPHLYGLQIELRYRKELASGCNWPGASGIEWGFVQWFEKPKEGNESGVFSAVFSLDMLLLPRTLFQSFRLDTGADREVFLGFRGVIWVGQ